MTAELVPHWYVARTEPRHEGTALVFMRMAGIGAYVPWVLRRIVNHGKVVPRRELMFPGYIFVRSGMNLRIWATLRRMPGVVGLMCSAGSRFPTPLGEDVLEDIRRASYDGPPIAVNDNQFFTEGEAVRVTGGSYEGLNAAYVRSADERIVALITLFNRQTEVSIPANLVAQVR